mmetsp:Transcript_10641/g.26443  ORF Transcript_10641/g.26443 Transcript_10641/m.26443 type:complete len:248 (+) Transcript_10641:1319-2062(+)
MRCSIKSVIVTSHGCSPAAYSAAAISRSPLVPSCRSTATGAPPDAESAAVGFGANESCHTGGVRARSPAASSLVHSSLACSFSNSAPVASHASRKSTIAALSTTLPAAFTCTRLSPVAVPTRSHETPADAKAASTAAALAGATSMTMLGSSAKSAAITSAPAGTGRSRSRPRSPAKAISRRATRMPPSLTSWPASKLRLRSSDCTALKAAASFSGDSTSGGVSPSWPKTCARDVPPRRRLPSDGSMR